MNLACVDQLAKDNNDVNCLLICGDFFDRTRDSERMKTTDSKEYVRALSNMILKRTDQ